MTRGTRVRLALAAAFIGLSGCGFDLLSPDGQVVHEDLALLLLELPELIRGEPAHDGVFLQGGQGDERIAA